MDRSATPKDKHFGFKCVEGSFDKEHNSIRLRKRHKEFLEIVSTFWRESVSTLAIVYSLIPNSIRRIVEIE